MNKKVIIAIIVIIITGGVGYFFYRKNKDNKEDATAKDDLLNKPKKIVIDGGKLAKKLFNSKNTQKSQLSNSDYKRLKALVGNLVKYNLSEKDASDQLNSAKKIMPDGVSIVHHVLEDSKNGWTLLINKDKVIIN